MRTVIVVLFFTLLYACVHFEFHSSVFIFVHTLVKKYTVGYHPFFAVRLRQIYYYYYLYIIYSFERSLGGVGAGALISHSKVSGSVFQL